jgi:heme/copper-type cytochrome/quinol oxidase subunit 4
MPSVSTLVRAWGLMMALTALSIWAAVSDQGFAPTLAAMAAGVLKAVLILWVYLNLQKSGSGWKAVFIVFLAFISLVVLAAYLVGQIGRLSF